MAEIRYQAPPVSPLTMSCLASCMKRQLSLTHCPSQSTLFRKDRMTQTSLSRSRDKSAWAKKLELVKQQLKDIEKNFKAWSESTDAIARIRSRRGHGLDSPPEVDNSDWNGFAFLKPPPEVLISL